MMKLGIIAECKVESFETAQAKGLEFVEFCINVGQDPAILRDQIPAFKEAIARTGVTVGSIGRWGSNRIAEDGSLVEEELQASYRLIDAAAELGCPNFVCGVNYVEGLSFYQNCTSAIAYFSTLIGYASAKGVTVSVYNCRWNNYVHSPDTWRIIAGHLPELGIKYDPSHSRYDGGDYLQEMKEWGHRFKHVHIKGSVRIGGERFDDPPAGLDQTDWGTFMSILYAKGYDGTLSIEPHSKTWSGELGDKGVQFTIDYMKKLLFR
ncbi:sugar phosphate isomerase/epimerase family protein [Gorillibacterium sp. sgz5001074]|uniref:sugar phosphate isomerase/epimerase family protein n=1 Tax=Gorillibacterium sp. sgz5001074 TaxID=3446695 RepID=UPI003F661AB3